MNPALVGWALGVLYATVLILAALGSELAEAALALIVLIAFGVALYARRRSAEEIASAQRERASRPYNQATRDFITLR